LLAVAAFCMAVSLLCIVVIDQPVARQLSAFEPAAFWQRGVEVLESAIGLTWFRWTSAIVLVAAMVIVVLTPRLRHLTPLWMFWSASHLLAQVATRYAKELSGRVRPREWLAAGGDHTFLRDGVGFPSGHVTIVASLVIPLVVMFPRLWPLLGLVAYVMAARVMVNAHFVGDVIAGVGLVAVVTWGCGVLIRPLAATRS
jgi:membrane-associated phospholipid phosphatase